MSDLLRSNDPLGSYLWNAAHGASGMTPSLSEAVEASVTTENPCQITAWTVIVDDPDPLEKIIEASTGLDLEVKRIGLIGLVLVNAHQGAFVLGIWPSRKGVAHLVSTVPVTDIRWQRVERWVRKAAPALSAFQLDDDDLEGIGTALSDHGRVEVARLSARTTVDRSSYTRGWRASENQQRPTLAEVLEEVEGIATVKTLTIHVEDVLSVHLRKLAGATFYSGQFKIFEEVVLEQLAQAAATRRKLLENRERKIDEPVRLPIIIKMAEPLFREADAITAFIEMLTSFPNSGLAVFHRNPYLHLVVTDYMDGSNFDTFVVSDDEVAIHPGYRSSIGSLSRFTEHISSNLPARGTLEMPEPALLDRDDLVAVD